MSDLPSGPWRYRPNEHDDWGFVRDASDQLVANTCPPWLAEDFQSTPFGTPERESGPPQARGVAALLIRAEREADPTPLDVAWLVSMGGEIVKNLDYLISVAFKITGKSDISVVWCPDDRRSIQELSYGLLYKIPVPTRGAFRTAMRVLGITIEEKAQ